MAEENNTIKTKVELDTSKTQQEIIKLNAVASDSSKKLEVRIAAKNKQIELQNALAKKTIDALNKERQTLEGKGATEKELLAIKKKLDKANNEALKLTIKTEKELSGLNDALEDQSSNLKKLDNATGGVITKFKALAANPLVLAMTLLAVIFKTVQTAINRSEKASEAFGKVGAFLAGIMNGLVAAIEPVVEILGEALVFAIEKPKAAWDALVGAFEAGWNFIKGQVIDRFSASWDIVVGNFQKQILKLRIAWNDFTGDSEEAEQLRDELDKVNEKIKKAQKLLAERNQDIVDLYNDAKDAVVSYAETAVEAYNEAAVASEALANAERRLVKNRIALEKQQLKSLRLAEEERQIRDDVSKTMEERIAANTRLGVILDEQAKRELSLAQQNLNIARMQAKATGDTIENIEKIGDAEIKLLEIRERITGQRSEQLVNENALLKEQADLKAAEEAQALKEAEAAEAKRLEDKEKSREKFESDLELQLEFDELEKERRIANGESTLEIDKEILENDAMIRISQAKGNAEQIELIEAQKNAAIEALNKAEKDANADKEKAMLENTINGAAEAFGITQEVAVARMIMAAPEAIAGSFKEAAKTYAPPLSLAMGALGAAGTVAPIIKGLADIKKTRFSKKKGGSSGGSASISTGSSTGGAGGTGAISTSVISDIAANNGARLGTDSSLGSNAARDASSNVQGSFSQNVVFSEARYSEFQNQVEFKEDQTTL